MITDRDFQIHVRKYIEKLTLKKVYRILAFTWSPDETRYDMAHVKSRMDDQTAHSAFYYLYPEYRDYDGKVGLHYHGVIFVYDWRKWNCRYHNSFKQYKVKPMYEWKFDREYPNPVTLLKEPGLKGWVNYITKECHLNDFKVLSNMNRFGSQNMRLRSIA